MTTWERFLESRKRIKLVPMFSNSCKAFALQTCKDIHPHRACNNKGCVECKWTGVGPLRRGSALVCMVCNRSGKDHMKSLAPTPFVQPDTKPEPARAGKPRKLTRKEKRAQKYD